MATTYGNIDALRTVFSEYLVQRPGANNNLSNIAEPVRILRLRSSSLDQMNHWRGYELHLLREGTTPGACVYVALNQPAQTSRLSVTASESRHRPASMILTPGAYIRSEREFKTVYTRGEAPLEGGESESPSAESQFCFALVTDPFFRYREGRVYERRYKDIETDAPTLATQGVPVGPECEQITLAFTNYQDRDALYSGAAANFEVYWYLETGLWVHNPADDFITGKLGQVSPANCAASFVVPAGALRVYVKQTGAVTAGAWVHYVGGSEK